jgi:alpha-D-ribose 1-methylphosphonate 5-triphosphate synthase subunit PhnI
MGWFENSIFFQDYLIKRRIPAIPNGMPGARIFGFHRSDHRLLTFRISRLARAKNQAPKLSGSQAILPAASPRIPSSH